MELADIGVEIIPVNFGGFVPLSTVDWRGKSVCVVFLRGCMLGCRNCHNETIMHGMDMRTRDNIIGMVEIAKPLISGVVFSGGEPTMQDDELSALARVVKHELELDVSIQTSGVNPRVIDSLIYHEIVDKISIDMKPRCRFSGSYYDNYWIYKTAVQKSIDQCYEMWDVNRLEELDQIVTVFRGEEEDITHMINEDLSVNGEIIIQQGFSMGSVPLSFEELEELASTLYVSDVRIRTRDNGESKFIKSQ